MNKRVYIKTVGCQMNVLDSEMVIADLKRHGYTVVDSPKAADCILYNTCSVREHAEEKIYSALGQDSRIQGTQSRKANRCDGLHGSKRSGADFQTRTVR